MTQRMVVKVHCLLEVKNLIIEEKMKFILMLRFIIPQEEDQISNSVDKQMPTISLKIKYSPFVFCNAY